MNKRLNERIGNASGVSEVSSVLVGTSPLFRLIFITSVIALHALLVAVIIHSPGEYPVAKPTENFVAAMLLSESVAAPAIQATQATQTKQTITEISPSKNTAPVAKQAVIEPSKNHHKKSAAERTQEPVKQKIESAQKAAQPVESTPSSSSSPSPSPSSSSSSSALPSTRNESIAAQATIAPGTYCPKPDYPKASRRLLEEGVVTLQFLVDTDGHVLKAEIAKSSGFDRLDDAARQALSKCQFSPRSENGRTVQSWSSIRYAWRLK